MTLGVLAARQRGSTEDAITLIQGYEETTKNLGFCEDMAYIQLFGSSVAVMRRMIGKICELTGDEPEDVIRELAAEAAAWMSETQGVGGY